MNPTEADSCLASTTTHPSYTDYIANTNTIISTTINHPSSSKGISPHHVAKQEQDSNQPRKRKRASPEQLAFLEKTFSVNPSPNNHVREQLSKDLGMSRRSIQIWFQNRRAKVKNMAKRSSLMHDETMRMQYYAATAAAAACQAADSQQHTTPNGTSVSNTDLYYYYYYYYYNQQQQYRFYGTDGTSTYQKSINQCTPPPPPPMPSTNNEIHRSWTPLSTPLPSSSPSSTPISDYHQRQKEIQRPLLSRSSSSTPSFPSDIIIKTVDGRLRSQSIGHYSHNSYHQVARLGSSEPISAYHQHRYHSTSLSPAPSALSTHIWSPPPSSALMLNSNGMIPEEAAINTVADQVATPLPTLFGQDKQLCAPVPMDCLREGPNHYRMSVETLQIGTWKRLSFQPQDLVCFYDRQLQCMVWKIRDGQQQFKMHIMVDFVEKVRLDPLMERQGWARLSLTVSRPEMICFYMEDGGGTGSWVQCRDFTQDKQATTVPTHYMDGPALALRAEWMRLVGQNQHLLDLCQNNILQPSQQQQLMDPHGQSMLSNSTPSREVTPADMMMVLQQDGGQQSMLSRTEYHQDKHQDSQDLLFFRGFKEGPQDLLLFPS